MPISEMGISHLDVISKGVAISILETTTHLGTLIEYFINETLDNSIVFINFASYSAIYNEHVGLSYIKTFDYHHYDSTNQNIIYTG